MALPSAEGCCGVSHYPRSVVSRSTSSGSLRRDIATQLQLRDPIELVGSFDRPNLVYRVLPRAGELGWDVAAALGPLGKRASVYDDLAALVDAVLNDARPGDHVLVMSNGGFGGVHEKLLAGLRARTAHVT